MKEHFFLFRESAMRYQPRDNFEYNFSAEQTQQRSLANGSEKITTVGSLRLLCQDLRTYMHCSWIIALTVNFGAFVAIPFNGHLVFRLNS